MDADLIVVGNTYKCMSPLLEESFMGRVEKLYDLSALVEVSNSSEIDNERIQELNKRLIIPFSQIDETLTENN